MEPRRADPGLSGMPNRTQIISGFLDFVTFLVIEVLAGWLRFALVLDRLCSSAERLASAGRHRKASLQGMGESNLDRLG
jgi:hypothetical protein